nr:putative capsid protein [Picobirnavirus sp.]
MERKPKDGVRKNTTNKSRGKYNNKRAIAPGEDKAVHKQSHNDASWYMSDTQLVNDVASVSFNTALGNPITLTGSIGTTLSVNSTSVYLPGIMSIYTSPTIGVSTDANSPVNIAMRRLYAYVRHANSGHSNYDPADLMIYLLAMDSIYTYWAYMVRAYGVAQVFSRTNKYVGDALLTAMGVDPNIRENLADFRAYINTFAAKAQQWCVPRVMTYFLRHNWMYSNVYKDEDNDKAQMYLYVPASLYKYNATLSEGTAGGLEMRSINVEMDSSGYLQTKTLPNNYVDLIAMGNDLLNALAGQEDIGIISGDILKAYGADNLWKIDTIPTDYQVIPVFSEEVLEQIHNTAFAGGNIVNANGDNVGVVGLDVTQDTSIGGGCLKFNPIFNRGTHMCLDTLMDTWKEQVSAETVMTASRNMLSGKPFTPTPGKEVKALVQATQLRSCGSEICLFGTVFTLNGNVMDRVRIYATSQYAPNIYNMPRFNEAPIRPIMSSNGTECVGIFGEMTNYGILSKQNIDQIHEVALMSLFGVPFLK